MDEIWYSEAEWHADYRDMVKIATGEKFQYGGRLFSKTGSSYISAVNRDMSTKFGLLIDFRFWKSVTCLIFAAGGPMWMKFGLPSLDFETRTLYHVTATAM